MKQLYIMLGGAALIIVFLLGYSMLADTNQEEGDAIGAYGEDIQITSEDDSSSNQPSIMNIHGETRTVIMKTNKGDITLELFTGLMPITAGNFLKLAQEDFYDGVKFHRVIDGFMIQSGDPQSKDDSLQARWGTGGPGYAIEDEFSADTSNVRGTISMANAGPNSGGSQFFINLVDNTNLDYDKQPLTSKHPVFGRVTAGMEVVDAIGGVETGARDVPVEPVVIEDIVVE